MDAFDVAMDGYSFYTSLQDFRAAFASNGDMRGLHEASIKLREARSRSLVEYVRLNDAMAGVRLPSSRYPRVDDLMHTPCVRMTSDMCS